MTHEEYKKASLISKEEAQRSLFNEYFNYVYTIVFSRLRSCARREDIEECVSDSFADIYIYYDESRELNGDISGFIGTVARRKAADMYSRLTHKNITTVSVDGEEAAELEAPDNTEEIIENKDIRTRLLNCVNLLGEPDSVIIIQKYFFRRSSKEIAEIVSMSPEAVRMRTSRALTRLRKKLTEMNISL
jgi:RNA polymerase sigma-70 factor (ECF subfamily)